MTKVQRKSGEKSFSSINFKSFIVVVILLALIIILSGALSYFIPTGAFSRDENGVIIPDTYVKGEVKGIAIWRIITAPFRVFASGDALTIIMISLFLLIMSGVFNVMEKTGGVSVFIRKIVNKCGSRKNVVVCVGVLVFMAFGSFFGMFEELVTLLPLIVVFMLSMGFDTMMGLGVCMLSACFGFSAAITNPFSVGLASDFAGTGVVDGLWLRLIFFVCVYAMVCGFLLVYARIIAKNPSKSLTFQLDKVKLETLSAVTENEQGGVLDAKIFKVYAIFF